MENNEIIIPEKEISTFDPNYPAYFFAEGIKEKYQKAQDTIERLYKSAVKVSPYAAEVQSALQKSVRYVCDLTEEQIKDIDKGALKLTLEHGKTYAQFKDGNQYSKKIPIKRDELTRGINPVQIANAVQMQSIQSTLEDVEAQLMSINTMVREVIQGQQNDRIALYYSGLQMFLESQNMEDSPFRAALQAQALRSLCDSTAQLRLSMESDIRYLTSKGYEREKGKRELAISGKINAINQDFYFIHQTTMLRAGIYCKLEQPAAMAQVLDEYAHFIDNTVTKNASLLAQYDRHDTGRVDGLWASRSRMQLSTKEMIKALREPTNVLYLSAQEESKSEKV